MNSSYADSHLQPEEGAQEQQLQTDGEGWKTKTDLGMTNMGHFGASLDSCLHLFAMGHKMMFSLMELPTNCAVTS